MKQAVQKTAIPASRIFVIRDLREKYFDPVWHFHSEYQLFVVLEGEGTRFIGNSIKAFRKGELVLTGPNLPHLWRCDDVYFEKHSRHKAHGIVIYFKEDFLGDPTLQKEEMIQIRKLLQKSSRGLEYFGKTRSTVTRMMGDLLHLNGVASVIQFLKILDTLAHSRESHYILHDQYTNTFKEVETDRMNRVYEYVLKNFRKKISLEEIATILHMTATSFSRYFTIKTSKSFSRFIIELRIKHACKLLLESDETIAQICFECGFNTLSNFNKQFKAEMNRTPSQYRKEFLNL